MPAYNNDQEIRIHCLQICGGSVAEAKNAYYWVMTESKPERVTQAIGDSSREHEQRQAAQSIQRALSVRDLT